MTRSRERRFAASSRPAPLRARFRWIALPLATAILSWIGISGTQNADANGDTRALTIFHTHTKESATITFKRNGYYDADALKQLNWLLRDWRLDQQTKMDPRLFDIVWEVYREVGASEPIHVVSAYRAPETNAMLRRRSKAVAEHSQHMLGHAMDFYLPDVPMSRVREVGMRLQDGGVGFYPNAFNPFVHLDVGSVRSWPRMTADQLARLFPDGRTVHLPREGRPLAGYEEAKTAILARGGSVAGLTYAEAGEEASPRKSLWAMLFGGGGGDEDTEYYRAERSGGGSGARTPVRVASADPGLSANAEDAGSRGFPAYPSSAPEAAAPRVVPNPAVAAARARSEAPSPETKAASAPTGFDPLSPDPTARAIGLLATAPTPPRRPDELRALLAEVPLPPTRPVVLAAALGGGAPVLAPDLQGQPDLKGQMASGTSRRDPASPGDDRAALRALFAATAIGTEPARVLAERGRAGLPTPAALVGNAAHPVHSEFSSATLDVPAADARAFTGSAVAPIPVLR